MTADERKIQATRAAITAARTGEGYPWPPLTPEQKVKAWAKQAVDNIMREWEERRIVLAENPLFAGPFFSVVGDTDAQPQSPP